jgi:predicted XRE-type DNA-binding protein
MKKTIKNVRRGGRNIFEDLKLADAEELNAKAQIAYRICGILEERKLTQKDAETLLGVDQPKVSALLRGSLEAFSSDRLFRFLNALDRLEDSPTLGFTAESRWDSRRMRGGTTQCASPDG